jgi:hypothetical protein
MPLADGPGPARHDVGSQGTFANLARPVFPTDGRDDGA